MGPRVFVSSIMEGYEEYRQAAKNGIIDAGGEPVLVEDYPSLSISPRSACLDGVASCDAIVIIVGKRGGWTARSGKLVVEEEYDEARRENLKVLGFVQDTERDEEAQGFADRLSDYVHGLFRLSFSNPDELRTIIRKSLEPVILHLQNPEVGRPMMEDKFSNPHAIYDQTALRFVLAPERREEMIDPVSLEFPDLKQQLLELGHLARVRLFSYERPKKTQIGINEIIIHQSEEGYSRDGVDEVRLELTIEGVIVIDTNVTGLGGRGEESSSVMAILEPDVSRRLTSCFAFALEFYDARDKFKRYDPLMFNAALSEIGYRTLMAEPSRSGSYSMRLQDDGVVVAFERPRVITRSEFSNFGKYVDMTMTLFRRRLKG